MKSKRPIVIISLAIAVLAPAHAFLDEETNDLRVDVVVDMTDAGRAIVRPTPERPAYYLPLSVGYQEMGAYVPYQKAPPKKAEVEYLLGKALATQGYRIMTKASPPSLVLVFWWGHIAPQLNNTEISTPMTHTNVFNVAKLQFSAGSNARPGVDSFNPENPSSLLRELPTDQFENSVQMISIVAGNTRDQYPTAKPNPIFQQVQQMERQPLHYLMISAYDFHDWLHHKSTLLWQAHVSTELWGRSLGDVLETMIATSAPFLGRETRAPQFIGAPVGHVLVGKAEVKGFPDLPVPPLQGK